MTGKTISEKILSRKSGRDVRSGDYVEAEVDLMLTHDVTGPLTFQTFREIAGEEAEIAKPENTILTIDHHAPADGVEAANNHNSVRRFAEAHGTVQYDVGDGICHQVIVEDGFVGPGDLAIGADSHSTTFGALGAFGTGVGSTDLAAALATGELWFRVPETIRFEIEGDLQEGVYAKDVILRLIGDVGFDGATYMTAEYVGSTVQSLPMHERLVLSNMAIEMGGKAGIVEPDERTIEYLKSRTNGTREFDSSLSSDDDAAYVATHSYEADNLDPQVSKPSNPEKAVPVTDVAGTAVDQVFVGTCTNGRYEDVKIVADILDGESIANDVRLIVVPASRSVYQRMLKTGGLDALVDAGAVVQSAGCGPCFGTHQGVLGDGDTCLATANRNFPGREGSVDSQVYLASPATAGATALYGEITDPRTIGMNRYSRPSEEEISS